MSPRKILFVDDSDETRELVELILRTQFKCEVQGATSGNHGIEILKRDRTFDLIISDYNMPDGTGADLQNFLINQKIEIPFVVLTAKKKTSLFALDPKTAIYQKPVSKALITKIMEDSLRNLERRGAADYIPVAISLLKKMRSINSPVYIRLNATKYVKIFFESATLSEEDLDKYLQKGIQHLYVESLDATEFLSDYQKTVFSEAAWKDFEEDYVDEGYKINAELLRNLGAQVDISKEAVDVTRKHVQIGLQILAQDTGLAKLIQRFKKVEHLAFADHCTLIIYICGFILNRMKRSEAKSEMQILTLAAFIHDVSLDDTKYDKKLKLLHSAKLRNLEKEESDIFGHPEDASRFSKNFDFCHPEVETVCRQHHERPDGSGFPNRTKASYIHPLSAIFAVAEDFVDHFIRFHPRPNWNIYIASRQKVFDVSPYQEPFLVLQKKLEK
jgi:response regulator RpfG family c-di-GMP phosphodiesterase